MNLMQVNPPYVSHFARSIRAVGGTIWHMDKCEYGFLIRATVVGKIIRVVFPPLCGKAQPIPPEPNSILYVASSSTDDFIQFLQKLSQP